MLSKLTKSYITLSHLILSSMILSYYLSCEYVCMYVCMYICMYGCMNVCMIGLNHVMCFITKQKIQISSRSFKKILLVSLWANLVSRLNYSLKSILISIFPYWILVMKRVRVYLCYFFFTQKGVFSQTKLFLTCPMSCFIDYCKHE